MTTVIYVCVCQQFPLETLGNSSYFQVLFTYLISVHKSSVISNNAFSANKIKEWIESCPNVFYNVYKRFPAFCTFYLFTSVSDSE